MDFSKEFYHWLAFSGNEAQQLDIGINYICTITLIY